MHTELNSVEDIDSMLDQEYNLNDVEDTENDGDNDVVDENDDKQTTDDNNNDNGENDDLDVETDNQGQDSQQNNKLSQDDKRNFAFSQLRKQNNALKNELANASKNDAFLKNLALQYGYNDIEEFKKEYEKARVEQEAKEKGYDPELYRQLQESNKRIQQLEEQSKQSVLRERAANFKASLDNTISEYNLTDSDREEIFSRLENAGYTIDLLLNVKNPEYLIKGVILDKIVEATKQAQINKVADLDNNLSDERIENGSQDKTFSLDELIKNEIKEYKEQNFYN